MCVHTATDHILRSDEMECIQGGMAVDLYSEDIPRA